MWGAVLAAADAAPYRPYSATSPAVAGVGTPTAFSTSGTDAIPVVPNTTAGDIVTLVQYCKPYTLTVTPPAGFVEAPNSPVPVSGSNQFAVHILWKRASGVDTGTYDVGITGTVTRQAGVALRVIGAAASGNPWETATSAIDTDASDNLTPAVSLTTTYPDELIMWVGASDFWASFGTLTDFTEQIGLTGSATSMTLSVETATLAVPGATGSLSVAANLPCRAAVWMGALKSAGAASVPTITGMSPNPGPAGAVTINGNYFITGATVSFAATQATNVVVVNSNQITCTAPAHADGTVQVRVTTGGGTSSPFNFTYQAIVLSVANITANSVDLSWSPSNVTVSEVGRDGSDIFGNTGGWVGTLPPPPPLTLINLIPDTLYTLYIMVGGVTYTIQATTAPEAELQLWDMFVDDSDTPTPTTADSGQSWTRTRNRVAAAPAIASGKFVNNDTAAGVSANYLTAQLDNNVIYMECDWDWAVGGSTNGANCVMAAWNVNLPADSGLGAVPDSPCHLVVTPSWLYYSVWSGGAMTYVGSVYNFSSPLVTGYTYHMEVRLDKAESTAYVLAPDGAQLEFNNGLIGSVTAHYATTEIYLPNANTDHHTRIEWFGAHTLAPTRPTITGIEPTIGAAGPVTITGAGFTEPVAVIVDGAPATGASVVSAAEITCTLPAHADGPAPVRIRTKGGTSLNHTFTYSSVTPPGPSTLLPFDIPNMSSSPKKALAHYFYFPRSIDNLAPNADYYATSWIPQPASYGGYVRNRPIPRATLGGDWMLQDKVADIEWAMSAGIDGFFVNIMWSNPADLAAWPLAHFTKLIEAAQSYPGFLVVPMLDVSTLGAIAPATAASIINEYFGQSSTWMDGGTMIVGSYSPTACTPAWWSQVIAACASIGMTVKFCHVYSGNQAQAPNYAASAYATGIWGPTSDASIPPGSTSPDPAGVWGRGEKFLSPVWITDVRPYGDGITGRWSESLNTLSLTEFWDEVIRVNSDIVQMCTWSDYTEGSEFQNSCLGGLVAADISAYYQVKWKTGSFPPIARDCVYLSYRNHISTAPVLGPQTRFMQKWSQGSATRFAVEALCFLTQGATVTIDIGGTTQQFAAPAGVSRQIMTVGAHTGTVSVTAVRGGATVVDMTSPIPIRPSLWADDWHYCMVGSLRGTTGQFDCQTTSTGTIPTYPS